MGKRVVRALCSVYKYLMAQVANANPKQAARIRERAREHVQKCRQCQKTKKPTR